MATADMVRRAPVVAVAAVVFQVSVLSSWGAVPRRGIADFFSRLAGVFVTGFSLSVLLELWGVKLLLFIDDVSCFDLGKVLFVYVIVVEGSNGYRRSSEWVCLCFMGRRSRGLFGLISWRRLRLGNYGFFDLILMECCWLVCLLCKEHLMVGMLRFLGE